MERRIAALGILALLLGAVVAVQLLDPQFGEEDPPEVDFSEPPNEVAADAAKQFEYVDYAYRVDIKYGEKEEWRQWGLTQVDHSNEAYRKVGPRGEKEEVLYGTSAVGFVRPSMGEDWQVIGSRDLEYPERFLTQPIHADELKRVEGHIATENQSTVTIYFDVNPVKMVDEYPGNSTISVDKSTGMIESVHVVYNPHQTGTRYLRLQVIERGTTVERPKNITRSLREICWDLLRGPLFRIDWLL